MRKGQTPPKSEPQNDQKRYETESRNWRNVAYGNPLKTKTKMALVGSGCEKAKHHLIRAQNDQKRSKPEAEIWRNVAYGTL